MRQAELDEVARRPRKYWNVDGLPELVMGLLWVVWGGAWLLGGTLPRDGRWNVYWLFVPAALVGSAAFAVWLIKRLKARFTFPRTGYVEWKEPNRRDRLGAAAVALMTAVVLVRVAGADEPRGNVAAMMGGILALAFVVSSLRQRAAHHLGLAAVALALGIALGETPGGWMSVNLFFVTLGAAAALLGAARLAIFLRRHPSPRVGEA